MILPPPGIRYAVLATMCFAIQDGVSKHLAESYPVPFFLMLRYWVFALFVAAVAARQPGGLRRAATTRVPLLNVIRGVLLILQIMIFVAGLHYLGMAPMMALFALYPLLITVLAIPILGETVGWRRFMAVGFGFLGVLVILRPGLTIFDPNALFGLAAAFGMATYSLLTRVATQADGGSEQAVFYTAMAGVAAISVIGPFFWVDIAGVDLFWVGALAVAGLIGHSLLIRAYDMTEAVRLQPFSYLQMVFGVSIGWIVFHEPMDPWMIAGMSMIIGAGLYALFREMRAAQYPIHMAE